MPLPSQPPSECANCGAEIPRTAKACPECGADERTGWRETSIYDDLDLPDEAFADDTSDPKTPKRPVLSVNGVAWYWWLVGLVLLVLVGGAMLGLR